jgi:hypothetical protein
MLLKYVNLGSGWRHRLFVLQDGVLRYYKVRGCVWLLRVRFVVLCRVWREQPLSGSGSHAASKQAAGDQG